MKIYIAHSRKINYLDDLYRPIKESNLYKEHDIILPHDKSKSSNNTRDFYRKIDLVIAEVSEAATGLGIELGWLWEDRKKIYCIHRIDKKISGSIKTITDNIISYSSIDEMMNIINDIIEKNKGKEYNKLVRDNIPEIIKSNNEVPVTRRLKQSEYRQELERKLLEEYQEVINSKGKDRLEELADMLEVIEALAINQKSSLEDIMKLKEEKRLKRGAFKKKIFLEKVILNEETQ